MQDPERGHAPIYLSDSRRSAEVMGWVLNRSDRRLSPGVM